MVDGVRLEVQDRGAEPVVVKTATTEAARAALALEADRLTQARHPGVVELLHRADDHLVLAWAGSQTLETLHAPMPVAAGLLVAVAATVAELHELGVVHGRIEPAHVVVGGDGRPRLCGFGPAAPATDPMPTDDVAAVGQLIDALVGRESEIEPIPERRWGRRRWLGYQRRSLQTLADQATHDDPARRPTARALAVAIAEAVPDAHVAQTSAPDPPGPHAPEPTAVPEPPGPAEPAEPAEPVESEAAHEAAPLDGRRRPSTGTPAEPPVGRAADVPESEAHDPGSFDDVARVAGSGPGDVDPTTEPAAQPSVEAHRPAARDEPAEAQADEPVELDQPGEAPDPNPGAPLPHPLPGDILAGPASGRPVRRRRWTGLAAAALVGVTVVVGAAMVPFGGGDDREPHRPPATDGTPAAPSTDGPTRRADPAETDRGSTDPPTDRPAGAPTADRPAGAVDDRGAGDGCEPLDGPAADVDGDGCPEAVRIDGTTVTVDGVSYAVGEQGDQVALGDWDCDGRVTPALARPSTGEVFVFDAWPQPHRPLTAEAVATVPGLRTAAGKGAPCATLEVTLADGSTQPVEARP